MAPWKTKGLLRRLNFQTQKKKRKGSCENYDYNDNYKIPISTKSEGRSHYPLGKHSRYFCDSVDSRTFPKAFIGSVLSGMLSFQLPTPNSLPSPSGHTKRPILSEYTKRLNTNNRYTPFSLHPFHTPSHSLDQQPSQGCVFGRIKPYFMTSINW